MVVTLLCSYANNLVRSIHTSLISWKSSINTASTAPGDIVTSSALIHHSVFMLCSFHNHIFRAVVQYAYVLASILLRHLGGWDGYDGCPGPKSSYGTLSASIGTRSSSCTSTLSVVAVRSNATVLQGRDGTLGVLLTHLLDRSVLPAS